MLPRIFSIHVRKIFDFANVGYTHFNGVLWVKEEDMGCWSIKVEWANEHRIWFSMDWMDKDGYESDEKELILLAGIEIQRIRKDAGIYKPKKTIDPSRGLSLAKCLLTSTFNYNILYGDKVIVT